MRVATSPARLQVNQLPVLGDELVKYAASNWTLVNQGGWGNRGASEMVRVGDGVENGHKRRAYERNSISHVNNMHLEYGKYCLENTLQAYIQGPWYI